MPATTPHMDSRNNARLARAVYPDRGPRPPPVCVDDELAGQTGCVDHHLREAFVGVSGAVLEAQTINDRSHDARFFNLRASYGGDEHIDDDRL